MQIKNAKRTFSMKQKERAPAPKNSGTRLKATTKGAESEADEEEAPLLACTRSSAHWHACSNAQLSDTRWSRDILWCFVSVLHMLQCVRMNKRLHDLMQPRVHSPLVRNTLNHNHTHQ